MQNTEIFKKIMAGEIPHEVIYQDDYVYAFLDINPVNPGHTLVIPKEWSSGSLDAKPETLERVIVAVQKVAKAIKEATGAPGINIIQNEGEAAGQKVFHLHFHVVPRHEGDGFEHWPGTPYKEGEAVAIGEKIRQML